jgi:hypothetical protein
MLLQSIQTFISKTVREYNSKLSEKYNLDIEELEMVWNEISGTSSTKKSLEKKETASETASVTSKKSGEGTGCPYLFTKGKNEGSTCGSKPKDGGQYCGKHQKYEGVEQKEKKKIPLGKKSIVSPEKNKKDTPAAKPQIVIRMNKDINKYWNPETTLVFKSKDDRVVIGSYKEDVLHSLNDDDINTCEKYGFKYEKEVEKKPEKKVVKQVEKKETKKSLSTEIVKTNLHAEHVENVLAEICKNDDVEDAVEDENGNEEDDDFDLEDIEEDLDEE